MEIMTPSLCSVNQVIFLSSSLTGVGSNKGLMGPGSQEVAVQVYLSESKLHQILAWLGSLRPRAYLPWSPTCGESLWLSNFLKNAAQVLSL